MAERCAACGSVDTGAMLDTFTCHACAAVSDYEGNVVSAGNGSATQPAAPSSATTTETAAHHSRAKKKAA